LYILFIIIIEGILLLYIYLYIIRLPSNKIYREVGRAKHLSAPLYTEYKKMHDMNNITPNCKYSGVHFLSNKGI